MAKQLNVNVAVTADTAAAKAQLQELQNTLQQLTANGANLKVGLNTSELSKAISDVDKLQLHLKNAMNTSGTLDFTKLSSSIRASGSTLQAYGDQLLKLGPEGQKAFTQLTAAITKSEVPMNRMKGLLGEFGTVLGNTIKWQAASSAIHGMMGSIQHAFSYAQSLNESLNKIQIVTNASDDSMAKFAESANKAAQRLNTTTTAYTDASLIYYQQGLSDKQVAERTEVTIKMANAAGVSAQKVSDQMTAVWNNFDDGSHNLEYYADVMTALGAATASSTDEISTGLQKFASVADTVGLSYENAAAALATITATTRQSADSVGTGLRTLFSRLQSLNLGETLDDGVTLTKYTKALETIGVNALDATGNLRSMDDILEDMGSKWDTLNDAQKTALAQTVGGVRQYTTLIALMDNFDFYKQNQQVALNSEGTVQQQADIYAKSWEASQKRVKSAMESIYNDLINDDFFIGLNDTFAGLIKFLDQIIDGFGGLKTLLPGISALLMSMFSDKISSGMVNLATTLSTLKPGATKAFQAERQQFLENAAYSMAGLSKDGQLNKDQKVQLNFAQKELALQQEYIRNQKVMTDFDRQYAQQQMDRYSNLRQQYAAQQQKIDTNKIATDRARSSLVSTARDNVAQILAGHKIEKTKTGKQYLSGDDKQAHDLFKKLQRDNPDGIKAWFTGEDSKFDSKKYFDDFNKGLEDTSKNLKNLEGQKDVISNFSDTSAKGIRQLTKDLKDLKFKNAKQEVNNLISNGKVDETQRSDLLKRIEEQQQSKVNAFADKFGLATSAVNKYRDAIIAAAGDEEKLQKIAKQIAETEKQAAEAVRKRSIAMQTADNIIDIAKALTSMTAAANSAKAAMSGIFDMFKNGASFSSITGVVSGVGNSFLMMGMAAKSLMAVFTGLSGPLALLIAAFPVILGALSSIYDQFRPETEEEKIERLKTELEEAKTEAQNAKAAYDELLSTQSSHNDLLNTLKELTVGTNEFYNALIEANTAARDLIKEYNLSYGKDKDWFYNDQGAIDFTESGNQNMTDQAKARLAFSTYNESLSAFAYNEAVKQPISTEDLKSLDFDQLETKSPLGKERLQDVFQYYKDSGISGQLIGDWETKGLRMTADDVTQLIESQILPALLEDQSLTLEDLNNQFGPWVKEFNDMLLDSSEFNNQGLLDLLMPTVQQTKTSNYINVEDMLRGYAANDKNYDEISQFGLEVALDKFKKQDSHANEDISEYLNARLKDLENIQDIQELADLFVDTLHFQPGELIEDPEKMKEYIAKGQTAQHYGEEFTGLINDNVESWSDYQTVSIKKLREYTDEARSLGEEEAAAKLQLEQDKSFDNADKSFADIYDDWIKSIEEDEKLTSEAKGQAKLDLSNLREQFKQDWIDAWSQGDFSTEDLGKSVKSLQLAKGFGEKFQQDVYGQLFKGGELNTYLNDLLGNVDFSDKLHTLLDWKALLNLDELEDSKKEMLSILTEDLLEDIGGPVGVLSSIFEDADFQKEFKKVQKAFKKTGKIGMDEMEDLIDASEDLSDALYYDVIDSVGAVADAFELYSVGAIDNIESIEDSLWNALDVANSLADALAQAFKHIDEWKPDRSIQDIDKHYGNVTKDYFDELKHGTTGSERLYQDAGELFNKQFADSLRGFFYGQERSGSVNEDAPEARYKAYQTEFTAFDQMMQQVSKTGDLSSYWAFMMDQSNQAAISKYMGVDAKAGLEGLGFSVGKDKNDIELEVGNRTTDEILSGLQDALNISSDQAAMLLSEYAGHSAAVSTDLKTNDFLAGWDLLTSDAQRADYLKARENNGLSAEMMAKSVMAQNGIEYSDEKSAVEQLQEAYGKQLAQSEQAIEKLNIPEKEFKKLGGSVEDLLNLSDEQFKTALDSADLSAEQLQALRNIKENAKISSSTLGAIVAQGKHEEEEQSIKNELKKYDNVTLDKNGKAIGHKGDEEIDISGTEAGQRYQERMDKATKKNVTDTEGNMHEQVKDVDEVRTAYEDLGLGAEKADAAITSMMQDGQTFGKSFTDTWGNMHTVTANADESLEQFEQRFAEVQKNFSAAEVNQLFGKQLFQGMMEGMKELSEGTSEWAKSFEGLDLKLPLQAELSGDATQGLLEQVKSLNATLTIANVELSGIKDKITDMDSTLRAQDIDVSSVQDKLTDMNATLKAATIDISGAQSKLQNITATLKATTIDITGAQSKLTDMNATLKATTIDLSAAQSKLENLQAKLVAGEISLAEVQSELTDIDATLSASGITLTAVQGDLTDVSTTLSATGITLTAVQGDLTNVDTTLSASGILLDAIQGDLTDIGATLKADSVDTSGIPEITLTAKIKAVLDQGQNYDFYNDPNNDPNHFKFSSMTGQGAQLKQLAASGNQVNQIMQTIQNSMNNLNGAQGGLGFVDDFAQGLAAFQGVDPTNLAAVGEALQSAMTAVQNMPTDSSAISDMATDLQSMAGIPSIDIMINVESSMPKAEIDHLADDFEDMAVKYNSINVNIQLDDGQVEKVKDLKKEFNELRDILREINGFGFGNMSPKEGEGEGEEGGSAKDKGKEQSEGPAKEPAETQSTTYGGNVMYRSGSGDKGVAVPTEGLTPSSNDSKDKCCPKEAMENLNDSIQNMDESIQDNTSEQKQAAADAAKNASKISQAGKEDTDEGGTSKKGKTTKSSEQVEIEATANVTEVDTSNVDGEVTVEGEVELEGAEGGEEVEVPVTADTSEVSDSISEATAEAEGATGTVKIDGNASQAEAAINAVVAYGNSQTSTITVDANTGPAQAAINALNGMSVTINVSVNASALGSAVMSAARGSAAVQKIIDEKHLMKGYDPVCGQCGWGETPAGRDCQDAHFGGGYFGQGGHLMGATGGFIPSYVNGSATNHISPGVALTGEEGPEIVWNKQEGYAYITGAHHPQFANLHPGDRIFNANDTRKILNYDKPDSGYASRVIDPKMMEGNLLGSYASGYGSYGPQSSYGGGHGSNKGEKQKRQNKKEKDYTPERYHLITRQVQDLTFWYEELQKARENAYGVNVITAIDKEIEATKNLVAANREYLDEINDYLTNDKKALIDLLGEKNISFDESGNIKNWEELQEKYRKAAESGDDENAAKIWKAIEQYEETLDKYQEIYEEFTDLLYQEAELRLEKITAKVEMEIKFEDTDVKLLQHYLDKIEDNAWAIGDALDIVSKQIDLTAQKINTTRKGIEKIFEEMRGQNANQILIQYDKKKGDYVRVKDDDGKDVIKTDWEEDIRKYIQENKDKYAKDNPNLSATQVADKLREQYIKENGLTTLDADQYIDMILKGENFHINGKWGEELENYVEDLIENTEDLEDLRLYAAQRLVDNYDQLAEDIERQVELFDHFASTLSTLQSITELQGIRMPKMIKDITKQIQQASIENTKNLIQSDKARLAELEKTHQQLQELYDSATDERLRQVYKEALQDNEEEQRNYQEAMLSALGDGLQTARDMFDAAMQEIVASYERAISAMYGTNQNLSDAIDRGHDIADQYVDDYEKFYQLTKLERNIHKDIDDRTNKGIKNNQRLEAILQEINGIRASGQKMSETELDLLQKRYDIAKAESDLEDARSAKSTVRLQRDRNGNWGYVYTAVEDEGISDLEQARDDSIYEYQKALTESMNDLASRMADLMQQYQQMNVDLYQQFIDGTITQEEYEAAKANIDAWFSSMASYINSQVAKIGPMAAATVDIAKEIYETGTFNILDRFRETVEAQVIGVNNIVDLTSQTYQATLDFREAANKAINEYEHTVIELDSTLNPSIQSLQDYSNFATAVTKAVEEESGNTAKAVSGLTKQLNDWVTQSSGLVARFQENYDREMNPVINKTEQFINKLVTALGYMNGLNTSLEEFDSAKQNVDEDLNPANITDPSETATVSTNINTAYNDAWIKEQEALIKQKEEQERQKALAEINRQRAELQHMLHLIDTQSMYMYNGAAGMPAGYQDPSRTIWAYNGQDNTWYPQTINVTANFPNARNRSEILAALRDLDNQALQYANRAG